MFLRILLASRSWVYSNKELEVYVEVEGKLENWK